MPRWPAIMAPRSSRHGRGGQRTRRRLRSPCRLHNAGSWPACATSVSFPWQNSMPLFGCWSSNSTPARCAVSAPAAPNCSPRSIVSSWESCRTSHTFLRAGSVAASPPTITSRSMAIGIPPPYRLIRELVDVRIADKIVEIFHKGQRIASHARAPNRRGHTTIADHMPSAHRRYGKWTPGGLIAAGEKIGPSIAAFFQDVIAARPHPEQGFRTCLGILSLTRSYDNARIDAACRRGIQIKARSVASIRSILKNGLDRTFLDETSDDQPLRHGNIRGQGYFH